MRGQYRRGAPGKDRLCGELPMRAKVVAEETRRLRVVHDLARGVALL